MEKISILQIVPSLNEGGVETGTEDLARGLVERGFNSYVISSGGKLVKRIEACGSVHASLPVHKKNVITIMQMIGKVREFILENKISLVHAASRVPAWISYFAVKGLNVPFVTSAHGYYSPHFFSRIMTKGDIVIAVSSGIREHLTGKLGCEGEKIRIVERGIDIERFEKDCESFNLREKYNLPYGAKLFGVVGRLSRIKGQDLFLKALVPVIRKYSNVYGIIVGSAHKGKEDYLEMLKKLAIQLKIENNIIFTGGIAEMERIYPEFEALVVPSVVPESFGRTAAEALACKVPVIASDAGGLKDIVDNGINGYLFKKGDYNSLSDFMTVMLEDNKKAALMGENGFLKVKERFSLQSMVEKTISVYRELL